MSMLLTGASGRLGRELVKVFPDALKPSRQELDITDWLQTRAYFNKHKVETVIHTAALTSVEECENNRQKAYLVNVEGTKHLLNAVSSKCYFILISSACVFRGDEGNYSERCVPCPVNYYGLTKLLAETIVSSHNNSLIIRTNFAARERWEYPTAFTDRFGTYLFADDVAHAIKDIVALRLTGVVHVCGDRKMSMFALAKLTTPDVKPMTMKDYMGKAHLTVDMSLSSSKLAPFRINKEGYA